MSLGYITKQQVVIPTIFWKWQLSSQHSGYCTFSLSWFFYLVLALTNPRVNQRRRADPRYVSRLKFPALAQRLSQNASLQHEKWVMWNEDISPLTSTFAKRYVKDVRQGLWATFQESIFYLLIGGAINIRATGPSHCYKAYLQPCWIISSLEDDIWLSLPFGTGETKWGQS